MAPLIFILLLAGAYVAFTVFAKKLRGKIAGWHDEAAARDYELDLTHRAPPSLQFDLFTAVGEPKVWTTVTKPGSNDSAMLYRFEVWTGDTKQKRRRTCAVIELPFAAPKTTLRPRSLQTAPARPTDGDDLLVGPASFDEMFRVQGSDAAFAAALLQPAVASWLQTAEARVGEIEFELRDTWLLCAGPKADDIDAMIDMLEWAQRFRDRMHAALQGQPLD